MARTRPDETPPVSVKGLSAGDGPAVSLVWVVRLRWLAGAFIIAISLAGWLAKVVPHVLPPVLTGMAILAFNAALALVIRRFGAISGRGAPTLWLAQVAGDLAALTVLVYFMGGSENPLLLLYVLPFVYAGAFLHRWIAFAAAAVGLLLFGLVAVGQAAVPALYHPLGFRGSGLHFENWTFVITEIAAVGVALFVTTFLSSSVSRRIATARVEAVRGRDVLDAIISSMAEGLVFLSPDGRVLLSNPAMAHWFPPRASGESGGATTAGGTLAGLEAYVESLRHASSPVPPQTFQMAVSGPDGTPVRQFQAAASGVFDRRGMHLGYVVVTEDITERLQLEDDLRLRNREILVMSESLRRSEREMAQREKMVSLGTMAAGIAHEIGNPLSGLSAVVQLLKRRSRSDDDRQHLTTLEEQIERIANIVRQTLEFSRPAVGQLVETDLDKLIEQTVQMVRYSQRARHVRIESVGRWDLPKVRIMPQQFQQVLVNLLLNALDAVAERSGERVVTVDRTLRNGWVAVRVKDNGPGMTREQIQQAFEPFYTTKPPGKGTGLGLAVSYRLVEVQGGRIKIRSAPGQGTTVLVSFPVSSEAPGSNTVLMAARPESEDAEDDSRRRR